VDGYGRDVRSVLERGADLLFTHAKWKEPVEFMHHCSTKWATFLLSLRDLLEKSEGRPLPRDLKIDVNR
jgi:hypothetical protein